MKKLLTAAVAAMTLVACGGKSTQSTTSTKVQNLGTFKIQFDPASGLSVVGGAADNMAIVVTDPLADSSTTLKIGTDPTTVTSIPGGCGTGDAGVGTVKIKNLTGSAVDGVYAVIDSIDAGYEGCTSVTSPSGSVDATKGLFLFGYIPAGATKAVQWRFKYPSAAKFVMTGHLVSMVDDGARATEVCVPGDFNGWPNAAGPGFSIDHATYLGSNNWVYAAQVGATGTTNFKFTQCGSWGNSTTYGIDGATPGFLPLATNTAIQGSGNINMVALTAGTYVISYNDSTHVYSVQRPPALNDSARMFLVTSGGNYELQQTATYAWHGAPIEGAGDTLFNFADDPAMSGKVWAFPGGDQPSPGSLTGTVPLDDGTGGLLDANGLAGPWQVDVTVDSGTNALTYTFGTPSYAHMYMQGAFKHWGAVEMTKGAGDDWTLNLAWDVGPFQWAGVGHSNFKFDTDGNWGNNVGGVAFTNPPAGGGWSPASGTMVVSATGSGNCDVQITSPGMYAVTFNQLSLAYSIVQTSTTFPAMYISSNAAGNFTAPHTAMTNTGAHTWSVTLALDPAVLNPADPTAATLQFQFDPDGNWGNTMGLSFGAADGSGGRSATTVTPPTGNVASAPDGNVSYPITAAGNYQIDFDDAAKTYTVTQL